MLSSVRAQGLPCDVFLADAGISPTLLQQVSARVTADQYVALFKSLIMRLNDDFLGLMSRPMRRGSFALIARSAIGAETLEIAMRRVARTFMLLQDDMTLEAVRESALAGWALRIAPSAQARPVFLEELLLRTFWRLLAWLTDRRLPIARFDFAFPNPPHADSYSKVFPAPLRFEQRDSAFWFDAARLQDTVRRDEAALRVFLADAHANVIVPRVFGEAVSARVRSHLQRAQPAWPDLVATAEALHLSTATLQRRLGAEGTSFQSLKDELRRDIAIVRLHTSAVPLTALAYELGFSDSGAFRRAFKGWTGSAPGAYRCGGA
jgi:AraC-like DNA-binding protein